MVPFIPSSDDNNLEIGLVGPAPLPAAVVWRSLGSIARNWVDYETMMKAWRAYVAIVDGSFVILRFDCYYSL